MTTEPDAAAPGRALLTHGLGSSWEHGWVQHGWPDLLADVGLEAVPFRLPGHADATVGPSASLDELTASGLIAAEHADTAIGFSLGAAVTLHLAAAEPERFRRLVLLGIGDRAWPTPGAFAELARKLEETVDAPDLELLRRAAASSGSDVRLMAEFLRGFEGPPPPSALRPITADVLVVLGDEDPVGPAMMLATSMSNVRVVRLPGVDHWRTPESPAAMAAVLDFLEPQ